MFRNMNFKYTDAEEEAIYAPELIESAYVDINLILKEIKEPSKFLVIGPKGAGKTALSEKLKLEDDSSWDKFFDKDALESFNYTLIDKFNKNTKAKIGDHIASWSLLLYLRCLPLLLKDEKFATNNYQLHRFHQQLKQWGILESGKLEDMVQYTSSRGATAHLQASFVDVGIQTSIEGKYILKSAIGIVKEFRNIFRKVKPTKSTYTLVLDGIDHTITNGRNNAPLLADLINATRDINIFFLTLKIKLKIILLFRNEILQIVPDPNLEKRKNDNGITMKWYDNPRNPIESNLLKIIEKRAQLVNIKDPIKILWKNWFPPTINRNETLKLILNNTRYLPRDLISFFRELQKINDTPPFSQRDVLSALTNYSDWFLGELSDALVGLVNEQVRIALPSVLSNLGIEFTLNQFSKSINEQFSYTDEEIISIAREMFNSYWIGNMWKDNGVCKYSWKMRKLSSQLNVQRKIVIHSGLWKSLNLL